jgi:23S rRNA (guanosine2251-2'-O)-methyltransferase
MSDYIEGKRPVLEALKTHVPLTEVLIADNLKHDGLVEDILRKAKNHNITLKTVRRKELDEMSERGSHQGVIARAKPFHYASVRDILNEALVAEPKEAGEGGAPTASTSAPVPASIPVTAPAPAPAPAPVPASTPVPAPASLIVVLDHITDAGNLGAVIRSASAVGASGVIIPNKRSAHVNASTYKSSAGAINHLKVSQVANIAQTLDRLKEEGYWVVGAYEGAQQTIWDLDLTGNIVLVMGGESEGLARLTQEKCDFLAKLPLKGDIPSLNVAQAATTCMYEWVHQNL